MFHLHSFPADPSARLTLTNGANLIGSNENDFLNFLLLLLKFRSTTTLATVPPLSKRCLLDCASEPVLAFGFMMLLTTYLSVERSNVLQKILIWTT